MNLTKKKVSWPDTAEVFPLAELPELLASFIDGDFPAGDDDSEARESFYREHALNRLRYETSIGRAIEFGELQARDSITWEAVPSYVNAEHVVVSIKDLQEYLKRIGSVIELIVEAGPASTPEFAETQPNAPSLTQVAFTAWHGDQDEIPPSLSDDEIEEGRQWAVAMQEAEARALEAERERVRRNWWGVSSGHIVSVMRQHRCTTAKDLFRKLEELAGESSPFERGEGVNRGALLVKDLAQSVSLKTVQNRWKEIKEAAFG